MTNPMDHPLYDTDAKSFFEQGANLTVTGAVEDVIESAATLGLFSSDCSIDTNSNGLFDSQGFNLVGDPGDSAFTATGDQTGVAPGVLTLGNHGCAVPLPDGTCPATFALPFTNPAVDAASCALSGATEDQRGFPRPTDVPTATDADDGCDIGAYEARDLDNDGAEDGVDTCPGLTDPDQIDTAGDGDLCDACFGTDDAGDADMDGFCADRDCDDSDPDNARLVFQDGFEAGNTVAWSVTMP